MMRLVAATSNDAKIRELRRVVGEAAVLVPAPPGVAVASVEDQAEGDGPISAAFAVVAAAKARAWSEALGGAWTIASDGGLLIPGLGTNWDPLRTRRFAGPDATDRERAERLLEVAKGLDGAERLIGWIEAVAIAHRGRVVATFTAEDRPGQLAESLPNHWDAERHGFWIPQIWLCPEAGGKRLADVSDDERAARQDHWDRLARLVRPFLHGLRSGLAPSGLDGAA